MLGVGDIVKKATALEGLAKPTTNQITNATEMFKLFSETLRTTVVFLFVSPAEVEKTTARLQRRFSRAVPVKGALGTAARRSTLIAAGGELSGRPGRMVTVYRSKATAQRK